MNSLSLKSVFVHACLHAGGVVESANLSLWLEGLLKCVLLGVRVDCVCRRNRLQ